jgi:DNA polymerase III epsilon subunit-like protein
MTTYVSVDVEAASLVPNTFSLLSVGAVTVEHDTNHMYHEVVGGTETADVFWEADTYDWWTDAEQELARTRLNTLAPSIVPYKTALLNMAEHFYDWLIDLDDNLLFVAWPASYDYPFIQLLFKNAGLPNPFNYRTIDVKSYACGKLGLPFDCDRSEFPDWFEPKPEMPHDALSDAMAQAEIFGRLLDYQKE